MAEGFARTYGRGAITPASAGLSPAMRVDPNAIKVMSDIGIDIGEHFPKPVEMMARMQFDLIVNISGHSLPVPFSAPVHVWEIADPVGRSEDEFRKARDLIQKLTIQLIDKLERTPEVEAETEKVEHESALSRRRLLRKIP